MLPLMANFPTNRHLLAHARLRGVSVAAIAKHLDLSRQTVSGRLNSPDRPTKEWVVQVLDALDTIESGVPTS